MKEEKLKDKIICPYCGKKYTKYLHDCTHCLEELEEAKENETKIH